MALIEPDISPQERTLSTLRSAIAGAYNIVAATVENCRMIVNANPWGLSPQAVFDLLADDGKELQQYTDAMGVLLNVNPAKAEEFTSITPVDVIVKTKIL